MKNICRRQIKSFDNHNTNAADDKKIIQRVENRLAKEKMLVTCLQYKSVENNVGKGEIDRNEQFLLLPQCFLPFWRTFCHFHEI